MDLGSKELFVPACNASPKPAIRQEILDNTDEYEWLANCKTCSESEERGPPKSMSWSAFHAERLGTVNKSIANIALMPLLLDHAHSAAVIKHAMEVVFAAVQHLNPGQTPVLAME